MILQQKNKKNSNLEPLGPVDPLCSPLMGGSIVLLVPENLRRNNSWYADHYAEKK